MERAFALMLSLESILFGAFGEVMLLMLSWFVA